MKKQHQKSEQEIIEEAKELVYMQQSEVIQCVKCLATFGFEYVFTQAMFNSLCPYDNCNGKWAIVSKTSKK